MLSHRRPAGHPEGLRVGCGLVTVERCAVERSWLTGVPHGGLRCRGHDRGRVARSFSVAASPRRPTRAPGVLIDQRQRCLLPIR